VIRKNLLKTIGYELTNSKKWICWNCKVFRRFW